MNEQLPSAASNADVIDLRELIDALWASRLLLAGIVALFTVLAIVYALITPPVYRSTAVVQIRTESGGGGGSALLRQLGGLADLAGISSAGDSSRSVPIATLQSRTLISEFIDENQLLPVLYGDIWDAQNKRWDIEDQAAAPTLWKASNYFRTWVLKVGEDPKTGLVNVSIEWTNPKQAQQWVQQLIAKTNRHLQMKAIRDAEGNLAYLQTQVEQTSVVPLQQALFTLLEGEQKKLMIAQGSEEYALQTIDSPDIPEVAVKPNRKLVVIMGFLLGLLVGLAVVIVRKVFGLGQSKAAKAKAA